MEVALRKTERLKQDGLTNPVGEVVVICPDGHPWTPTERNLFHIVTIPDDTPAWLVERMQARALKFAAHPTSVSGEAAIMAALLTYDDKPVDKVTELGRRAQRADILNTNTAIARMSPDARDG